MGEKMVIEDNRIHIKKNIIRCAWTGDDELYQQYHDYEWGRPVHDDTRLFELLILEGMQAGLSWITILRKRENFRRAFDNFDVDKVMAYEEEKIEALLHNEGIIRNRRKIEAAIHNAHVFREIQNEYGSFDAFLWSYVDKPIQNAWHTVSEVPATTELSDRISKDLKKHGFKFVGSTIIYALMQSIGMVNDHTTDCFCYRETGSI